MTRFERVREAVQSPLRAEYFSKRAAEGWKLVALEWEREIPGDAHDSRRRFEEVPFGLRVAEDCQHLEANPLEMQILSVMMELIVRDFTISSVAAELNRREFRTREGAQWSALSVFRTLPRMIEIAPHVHSSEDWAERRKHFSRIAWNS